MRILKARPSIESLESRHLLSGGIFYVNKSGSDTNDGSISQPWATIQKAITTVPGGSTVEIGNGVYQEDSGSGFLDIRRDFGTQTTFVSESGDAGAVVIEGRADPVNNVLIQGTAADITFRNVTFASRVSSNTYAVRVLSGNLADLDFVGCIFTVASDPSAVRVAFCGSPRQSYSFENFSFDHCTFNQTGPYDADGLYLTRSTDTDIINGVTLNDCKVTVQRRGVRLEGVTNATVNGGSITAIDGHGFALGVEASEGYLSSGTVTGLTVTSTLGHSLLIGGGCDGVVVADCVVNGGNQGLVVKECNHVTVKGCTINGGTINALYFKAAHNSSAIGNIITDSQGTVVRIGPGNTGHLASNITLTKNRIVSTGNSAALFWPGPSGYLGGGVCDENVYDTTASGNLGTVRSTTGITNLADLKAAWDDANVAGDDSGSVIVSSSSAVTYGLSNPAIAFSGAMTLTTLAGQKSLLLTSDGAQIDFIASGTNLTLLCRSTFASPVEVKIDGGRPVVVQVPVGIWSNVSLFSNLGDGRHAVTIKLLPGVSRGAFALAYNYALTLLGGSPALLPPAGFGTQYVLTSGMTARAIEPLGGFVPVDFGGNSSESSFRNDASLLFRASCNSIQIWTLAQGGKINLEVDGVSLPAVAMPTTGIWQWVTLANGLDPTTEHTYSIFQDSRTPSYIYALMTTGGAGVDTASPPTPLPSVAFYGDSLTVGLAGTGDSSHGYVRLVAAALGATATNLGVADTTVEATGPMAAQAGETRISDLLAVSPKPSTVVILYGRNDLGGNVGTFQTAYLHMISEIAAALPGVRVACLGILPAGGQLDTALGAYNSAIVNAVAMLHNPNLGYVNTTGWYDPASGGLNPNAAGYASIATNLVTALKHPFVNPTPSPGNGGVTVVTIDPGSGPTSGGGKSTTTGPSSDSGQALVASVSEKNPSLHTAQPTPVAPLPLPRSHRGRGRSHSTDRPAARQRKAPNTRPSRVPHAILPHHPNGAVHHSPHSFGVAHPLR